MFEVTASSPCHEGLRAEVRALMFRRTTISGRSSLVGPFRPPTQPTARASWRIPDKRVMLLGPFDQFLCTPLGNLNGRQGELQSVHARYPQTQWPVIGCIWLSGVPEGPSFPEGGAAVPNSLRLVATYAHGSWIALLPWPSPPRSSPSGFLAQGALSAYGSRAPSVAIENPLN